jgi:hypothetical protein
LYGQKKSFAQSLDLSVPEKKQAVYDYIKPEVLAFSKDCVSVDMGMCNIIQLIKDFENSLN